MTPVQRLQLEQSAKRQKLNELLALDELTDEQRAELETLSKRAQQIEVELRAAITAETMATDRARTETREDGEDAEARELRKLEDGASISQIFEAALERRSTDGQTAELQQHLKLHQNQVPLALLRDRDLAARLETRAVTPAPANVGQTQAEIIPAVLRPAGETRRVQEVFVSTPVSMLNVSGRSAKLSMTLSAPRTSAPSPQ